MWPFKTKKKHTNLIEAIPVKDVNLDIILRLEAKHLLKTNGKHCFKNNNALFAFLRLTQRSYE